MNKRKCSESDSYRSARYYKIFIGLILLAFIGGFSSAALGKSQTKDTSPILGISGLLGFGAPIGNAGLSLLYPLNSQWQFEIGIGQSIVTDTNLGATAYYSLNVSENTRHLFYGGYSLSLQKKTEDSQKGSLFGESPGIGSSADKPYDTTDSAYKGHWLNAGWGMEFGEKVTYSFLLGLGIGKAESTKDGQVEQRDGKFYRKKSGYRDAAVWTIVPLRITCWL